MRAGQELNCGPGPDTPVAEETAFEAQHHLARAAANAHGRDQIGNDMVVIAGIKCDAILSTRGHHAKGDIERLVAIKRRYLDGDHVVETGKTRPKGAREGNAANRGL